ncbi:MAG: hypothetical protein OXU25_03130 [Thaumarchaeota archaeon]|nr:hypothetical protein [Nitrososphaerota archaeon]
MTRNNGVTWDDDGIVDAISRLGEPERSIVATLLYRVRELEGKKMLPGGAQAPTAFFLYRVGGFEGKNPWEYTAGHGGLEGLAERVKRLEAAVGVQQGRAGAGSGAELADRVEELEREVGRTGGEQESLADRVERLEVEVGELRGTVEDARL